MSYALFSSTTTVTNLTSRAKEQGYISVDGKYLRYYEVFVVREGNRNHLSYSICNIYAKNMQYLITLTHIANHHMRLF